MNAHFCWLCWALAACGSGRVDDTTDSEDPVDDSAPTDDTGAPPEPLVVQASVHPVMTSIVVLEWTQEAPGSVQAEYSVDEDSWMRSPVYTMQAGPGRLLLLGIPFDTEVTWRLLTDGQAATQDARIRTGACPSGLPDIDHVTGQADAWDPSIRWFLGSLAPGGGSGGGARPWTFILDRQGRLVWANQTPSGRTTFSPQPSVDGSEILIDYNSWWGSFDGGARSQVARLDIEGTTLGTWDTPGLIHPFTQTGDGSIAWSAAQGGYAYSGEVLALLDPSGASRTLFDCNAFSQGHGGSYCGANTVWWNPENGHFLYSLYTLDTVIEVDAEGEPVRWFGHLPGSWSFSDPSSTFWWQHGTQYLDDGHLLVSTRRTESARETVIREYALDESDQSLVQIWSFGEGEGVYAEILGEPRRLPNGNTLHNFGSTPRIREVSPEGDVVWDVSWDDSGTLGCTHVVPDLYALWTSAP
ncbi:MAG: aryl-sulfate sulfotransferase [Deltaproteobacteria bacterium]|nr:aryl-sulfate sulfotransferase [Deltaproteobacteria bacterium]